MNFDVIVVGAGPAGSSLATQLGRAGMRVLLLDKRRFPHPKVCGEYMSPQALAMLDRLEVLDEVEKTGARKLQGLCVRSARGKSFRGDYLPVQEHAPYRPYGLGIRREIFDRILFCRAANTRGVESREGFVVRDLIWDKGRVCGVRGWDPTRGIVAIGAPLVVGADGTHSLIARLAGLGKHPHLEKFAFSAHFEGLHDENRGELHLGSGCYAGIAPVDGGLANVNLVVARTKLGEIRGQVAAFFEKELRRIPGMNKRLTGSRRASPVRGTGPMAWRTRAPISDGVLLVGDAADFVDPFTGEGIFMALQSAELAAPAIIAALDAGGASRKNLRPYQEARKRELSRKVSACWGLQKILYRERIMDWAVGEIGRKPLLAQRILGVSGDYVPPEKVLGMGFVWDLLSPFWSTPATTR